MTYINNFKLISPFLKWENKGDFYNIQLLLRKVDGTTTFGNKNNSARLIKSYHFYNLEQLLQKEKEIIQICELFGCRAGINLNPVNNERVAKVLNVHLAERILSGNFEGITGILKGAIGSCVNSGKHWLVDVDDKKDLKTTISNIKKCRSEYENIIKLVLPTYKGFHLITERFNREQFSKLSKEHVDIHDNVLGALYYPNK